MVGYIETAIRNLIWRLRGNALRLYLRLHGCSLGRGARCMGWPFFRQIPEGNIKIGHSVTIGRNVTFEVSTRGVLRIGNHVNISDSVLFAAHREVVIGDQCGFGERVSVRDSTHMFRSSMPHLAQASFAQAVSIGMDVSIGSGSVILSGAKIEDGVVLGAGTIVTSQTITEPYTFYRGDPPVALGKRP